MIGLMPSAQELRLAAVVGDVVGSRRFADQPALLRSLADVLEWVNGRVPALQPLSPTVGDEFQGVYADVGRALDAALLVRLRLADLELERDAGPAGAPDVRIGIGWGTISQVEHVAPPFGQSGSAWWHARAALEEVDELVAKALWPKSLRTAYRGEDDRFARAVNAFLICRDDLIDRMDARDRRVTLAAFTEETQSDVAGELGISQPAVARRLADKGGHAIFRAHRTFGEPSA